MGPAKRQRNDSGITLDRVEFVALNGGPQFKFTEAISFSVNCEDQDEIDYFWEKLSATVDRPGSAAGSKTNSVSRGRSTRLSRRYAGRSDAGKANRVMKAMMQ